MLFLAGALLQALYCTGKPPARIRLITITIFSTVSIMSAFYIQSRSLLVHLSMFVGMLQLIWPRTIYIITCREPHERRKYFVRFWRAVGYLALAFAVWNIDLEMCQELRNLRYMVGVPLAWLLELHGWWHILTAVGAARYMELIRDLCAEGNLHL